MIGYAASQKPPPSSDAASAEASRAFAKLTMSPGFRGGSAEDECQGEAEDGQRLGEGEAQERQRLQHATGLRLAGDAVDVGCEDQADPDAGADGRQAVAQDRDVSFHCLLVPLSWGGRQCSSAREPAMYRAASRTKMYACRNSTRISKTVITNDIANGPIDMTFRAGPPCSSMYSPPRTKSSSSRWPANMLPNRRRASVTGRVKK